MRVLFSLAIVCLVSVLLWRSLDRPLEAPDWSRPLDGLDYGPSGLFTNDQLNNLQEDHIKSDLERLAKITPRIRTYTVDHNLDKVPEIAKPLKLSVTLGIWLGSDKAINDIEVAKALAAVKKTPGVVDRIIVGNEVVLRNDLSIEDLNVYIAQVKKAVGKRIDVGTADVWSTWLANPEMAKNCDFIAVHILPYWDGVTAAESMTYIKNIYGRIDAAFPKKEIVIGEAGWPSEGRIHQGAVPSASNEAYFLRHFLQLAADEDYDYYILEAFDQPQKAEQEGAVGSYWGIFNANGDAKFSLTGTLTSFPSWRTSAAIGVGATFVIGLFITMLLPSVSTWGYLLVCSIIAGVAAFAIFAYRALNMEYSDSSAIVATALLAPCGAFAALIVITETIEIALSIWRKRRAKVMPSKLTAFPAVSIHVPTHNEPPAMVIETINALSRLDYPNFEVVILDNNTADVNLWKPVEAHCRALGPRFRFFHHDGVKGFKAGALNIALAATDPRAEFIGVIDSDYQVEPHWLKTVLPGFADSGVAIVQGPQDYRDADESSFKRLCYEEYAGFFKIGMVERGEHNAIIQHGTMCVMRKAALIEVGGWAEWCITEDTELGLRLFEAGYDALYTPQSLGKGLMPDTYDAYKGQRYRWVYGAMQIIKRHSGTIFGDDGQGHLTLAQKYLFITGWLPWIADAMALVFMALSLVWTGLMATWPHTFDVPATALSGVAVALFLVKFLKTVWLQQVKVRSGILGALGASLAGLSLGYTVGRAVMGGLVTSGKPFLRTPKLENAARLTRGLSMVLPELILFLAACAAIVITHLTDTTQDPAVNTWIAALAVMALPYGAAVVMAMISTLLTPHRRLVSAPAT
ncbi:MAG: glycosyltransferase [Rhodospirillaceae bacterium]|nr:MAG: glycosyltransferase [Rhodospirillaceae bacterium]